MKLAPALIGVALAGPLEAQPPKPKSLEIGAPAPAFDLPGVDGRNW